METDTEVTYGLQSWKQQGNKKEEKIRIYDDATNSWSYGSFPVKSPLCATLKHFLGLLMGEFLGRWCAELSTLVNFIWKMAVESLVRRRRSCWSVVYPSSKGNVLPQPQRWLFRLKRLSWKFSSSFSNGGQSIPHHRIAVLLKDIPITASVRWCWLLRGNAPSRKLSCKEGLRSMETASTLVLLLLLGVSTKTLQKRQTHTQYMLF